MKKTLTLALVLGLVYGSTQAQILDTGSYQIKADTLQVTPSGIKRNVFRIYDPDTRVACYWIGASETPSCVQLQKEPKEDKKKDQR